MRCWKEKGEVDGVGVGVLDVVLQKTDVEVEVEV